MTLHTNMKKKIAPVWVLTEQFDSFSVINATLRLSIHCKSSDSISNPDPDKKPSSSGSPEITLLADTELVSWLALLAMQFPFIFVCNFKWNTILKDRLIQYNDSTQQSLELNNYFVYDIFWLIYY